MKKVCSLLILVLLAAAMCACAGKKEPFTIPEAGASGGYRIAVNGIEIIVYATGDCKYVKLVSADGTILQSYATPQETVTLEEQGSAAFYHCEETDQPAATYENPAAHILDGLRNMTFYAVDGQHGLYRAEMQSESAVTKTVPYRQYKLQMVWRDGRLYTFAYFVYENGDILVSADAPDEINPYFTPDTPWIVDIGAASLKNTSTMETIPVDILSEKTDEGIPPEHTEMETVMNHLTAEIQVGEDGRIQTVRYIRPNMDLTVEILHDFPMAAPTIPSNAQPMTQEQLQTALMKLYAAESVI